MDKTEQAINEYQATMDKTEHALNEYQANCQAADENEIATIKKSLEELFGCEITDFEVIRESKSGKQRLVLPEWPNLQFNVDSFRNKVSVGKIRGRLKNKDWRRDIYSLSDFGQFLIEEEIVDRKKKRRTIRERIHNNFRELVYWFQEDWLDYEKRSRE